MIVDTWQRLGHFLGIKFDAICQLRGEASPGLTCEAAEAAVAGGRCRTSDTPQGSWVMAVMVCQNAAMC